MKKTILFFIAMGFCCVVYSQNIGIGTTSPNSSAQIDITSTNKGLLIPRMNASAITAIPSPAKGLMVYDSIKNQLMVNMGTPLVPNWQTVAANSGWALTGNSATDPATYFIGTNDNAALHFRINNQWAGQLDSATRHVSIGLGAAQSNGLAAANIAIGNAALKNNFTGQFNTVMGDSAAYIMNGSDELVLIGNSAGKRATGYTNYAVAIGSHAADSNLAAWTTIVGNYAGRKNKVEGNVMIGSGAGMNNTDGIATFIGDNAGISNTIGAYNTFIGTKSGFSNTTGGDNTANGYQSLYKNNTGFLNTATGASTLYSNTSGVYNDAFGSGTLYSNTTGNGNAAFGVLAMSSNTTGGDNTAIGGSVLYSNIAGNYNTGVGWNALAQNTNSYYNTAIGYNSGSHFDLGYNNTILGANSDVAGADFFNCIAIGQGVICTASSQARIGNSFTSSIGGQVGWTTFSDGRYKKDITENVPGLDFIMKLRPVTYRLNVSGINNSTNRGRSKELDKSSAAAIAEKEKSLQTGFVAQEVEKAATDAGYNFSGVDKPKNPTDFYGLRYAEFVVPVIKAMQEQQQQIELLKKENSLSQQIIADLQKRLDVMEKKMQK